MTELRQVLSVISSITQDGRRPVLPASPQDMRPPLPASLTPDSARDFHARLVAITQSCWAASPEARPSMAVVAGELRGLLNTLRTARQKAAVAAATNSGAAPKLGAAPAAGNNSFRQRVALLNANWGGSPVHGHY
jgi:hypothetical protein